jgi:hypothetical protein
MKAHFCLRTRRKTTRYVRSCLEKMSAISYSRVGDANEPIHGLVEDAALVLQQSARSTAEPRFQEQNNKFAVEAQGKRVE